MFPIIGKLDFPTTVGFTERTFHRIGHAVCIHDDLALCITRRTSDRLYERSLAAQESFLIRIQNRDKRNLRYIQFSESQIADDLHSLDRVDVVVHVADFNTHIFHISGQIFCHLFGQRGNQHPLPDRCTLVDLRKQVVDLPFNRTNLDLRVHQAGWPNHLFNNLCTFAAF